MPPLLALFDPVEADEMVWVTPDKLCVLESDIVFVQVASGFVGVPEEFKQRRRSA